ncbi:unnamed protein product [Linum trigynum]|uniref:Uncharacterized protein n=1 Tax=Linum trigynum TaxID=586398 RepID=A0AAV2GPU0_9ROSI
MKEKRTRRAPAKIEREKETTKAESPLERLLLADEIWSFLSMNLFRSGGFLRVEHGNYWRRSEERIWAF